MFAFALPPNIDARARAFRAGCQTLPERVTVLFDDRFEFAAAVLGAWSAGRHVVLPSNALPTTLARCPAVISASTDIDPTPLAWREDASLTLFTSGSTGAPTGIEKTAHQLFAEVDTLEATFGERVRGGAFVSTVSHQHIYGLLFSVLWPLKHGHVLTQTRLEYPEALEADFNAKACVLISSPAHLKRLPSHLTWQAKPRAVFSSGGPLSEAAAASVRAAFQQPVTEVFGSSETGGVAWREQPNTTWRALRGVSWRVVDGLLEVRSPHVSPDGWVRTSDRAEGSGEGFSLLGRSDRIVKLEEKRVSLDAVEAAADQTALVAHARALVGADGRLWLVAVPTEAGKSFLEAGRRALTEALREQLALSIERVALPRRMRFVDQLPFNEQGKTTDALLLGLFSPERPTVTWLTRDARVATATMVIEPDLRVLDGHFPEAPVVAGVAQLDWAIALGREAFGLVNDVKLITALKFQALLRPGMTAMLSLTWDEARTTLTFQYAAADVVFSSGRVSFTPSTTAR